MLPDRVSNPGPLTYESGALPIALRGPAPIYLSFIQKFLKLIRNLPNWGQSMSLSLITVKGDIFGGSIFAIFVCAFLLSRGQSLKNRVAEKHCVV